MGDAWPYMYMCLSGGGFQRFKNYFNKSMRLARHINEDI